MTTWFTSDHHFGHKNIILYQNRPFKDVVEMDEVMIRRWNECVRPGDQVYHLGDFAFARETEGVEAYVKRLAGQIHLILGNHDHHQTRKAQGFAEMTRYKELQVGDQTIVLSHYAMQTWNKMHRGSWQLHGHSHGNLKKNFDLRRIDVGVDPWGFRPISFEEVGDAMKAYRFVPVDHHGTQEEKES